MSYKRLNLAADIYFCLILLSGVSYIALLIVAAQKIMPALVMQMIFLLDALKFDNSLLALITSKLFLVNVIPGLLLLGLILKFGKSLMKSINSLIYTRRFIRDLNKDKITKNIFKFVSKESLIFTSGFLRPEIFISSTLYKSHNHGEMSAMIQHEENHRRNYHPLKIFISNFVQSSLPSIPGKNWLINNYLTLVEVSCDQFSESTINSKLPLVSALLKFQNQSFEPNLSYFNSQGERIKILVGQKKQGLKIPMAYYSLLLVGILSSAFLVKNTNVFYECQHLLKCVELLITPSSQPLVTLVNTNSNVISISDHCQ